MKYLLLILLLQVSTAMAAPGGIRVIGNGGGTGEMLALTASERLKVFLLATLSQSPPLEEHEIQFLKEVLANGWLDGGYRELEFFVDPQSEDLYRYRTHRAHRMALSSRALYSQGAVPIGFSELTQIVFVGWLQHPQLADTRAQHGMTPQNISMVAAKLFSDLGIADQEVRLGTRTQTWHSIQLQSRSSKSVLLSVEFDEVTLDLTPIVQAQLGCTEGAKLRTSYGVHFTEPFVVLDLDWMCDQELIRGMVTVELPIQLDTQTLLQTIVTRVNRITDRRPVTCQQLIQPEDS